jgi:hypothetical protein
MFLNFANDETPQPNQDWVALSDSARLDRLQEKMGKGSGYEIFQPTRAFTTGQVYVALSEPIGSSLRGGLLLDLEEHLKVTVDPAISVWCEPLGDKNSLRNLRGIEIKSPNEKPERGF